jgi:hypothetical protein
VNLGADAVNLRRPMRERVATIPDLQASHRPPGTRAGGRISIRLLERDLNDVVPLW